jgi:pyroglutamyl-peptidase
MTDRPRLLVTGFGPFPGAPDNPTERLVRALAEEPAELFGASALAAVVLPTEYALSWEVLRRLYRRFEPDMVMHFGLSGRAKAIRVETIARNVIDPMKPDAAGMAPRSGRARRTGPEVLSATIPASAIVEALASAGVRAALSDDAGDYVCNATLYRSLTVAPPGRRVGFIHVPPPKVLSPAELKRAAAVIMRAVMSAQPV